MPCSPLLIVPLLLVAWPGADATERLSRRIGAEQGLFSEQVNDIVQDTRGFLWISTLGGLFRYDGTELRLWSASRGNQPVWTTITSPDGDVVVLGASGTLLRVKGETMEPVPGPDGRGLEDVHSIVFDGSGRFWALRPETVLTRSVTGDWAEVPARLFDDERLRFVLRRVEGGVLVATQTSIWRVEGDSPSPVRIIGDLHHPYPLSLPGRTIVVAADRPFAPLRVLEVRDGVTRELDRLQAGNVWDVTSRADVIWISFERFICALRPGRRCEIIGPGEGLPSAGRIYVDREGSLWVTTVRGLIQFPEPETVAWNERDGVPNVHTIRLSRVGSELALNTWSGLAWMTPAGGAWTIETSDLAGRFCVDGRGRAWSTDTHGFIMRSGSVWRGFPTAGIDYSSDCATRPDGRVWLATDGGLYLTPGADGVPRRVPGPSIAGTTDSALDAVVEDSDGTLWVSAREMACRAPATEVLENDGVGEAWSCQRIGPVLESFKLIETQRGGIWVATRDGVYRWQKTRWERIPASGELPSCAVYTMSRSPRGGVWLGGPDLALRVEDRPDLAEGWSVLERLGAWQGQLCPGAHDIVEDPDGTLYQATSSGLVRTPPAARDDPPVPPEVALVSVTVDGRRLDPASRPVLSHHHNLVELGFAALTFRDRTRLRYRMRQHSDEAWRDLTGTPVLKFIDLPAGRYRVEMEASLDGVSWSPAPATFAFQVLPPWYLQWWAVASFLLAAVAALTTAYRLRVRSLLRLERQRARIAMDLHDEIGSGLGTIGILASLVRSADLPGNDQKDLAEKISATATELGSSLTDIVWALRPGAESLEALMYALAERAGRLFPAESPRLVTKFPSPFPAVTLSLPVRRNALLIGLEALHNAARHSGAGNVELGLAPRGRRWRLWVADDGHGLSVGSPPASGHGTGISGMQRRAEEIDAELHVASNENGGTTVALTFVPNAEDRRPRQAKLA